MTSGAAFITGMALGGCWTAFILHWLEERREEKRREREFRRACGEDVDGPPWRNPRPDQEKSEQRTVVTVVRR